ncbi:g5028 [Coccomyxa viridis]|uniref:G5028 protein n=1 Tax=Coccomyxa viridis TaxID=1274662 RepID=A0ABP1FRS6_9CHLO
MTDPPPITPQVRRKVHHLLRNKALTLLGDRNFIPDPHDPIIPPIAHELQTQFDILGYDWHNDTQHVAMRQKQWAVIFRQWPTPPVDFLHACRPHNLQVVPNKGSATLIASRKRAAGIHPSKPAYTPPPPPPPSPPPVPHKPRDPSLRKYNKTGKYSKKRALHTPATS